MWNSKLWVFKDKQNNYFSLFHIIAGFLFVRKLCSILLHMSHGMSNSVDSYWSYEGNKYMAIASIACSIFTFLSCLRLIHRQAVLKMTSSFTSNINQCFQKALNGVWHLNIERRIIFSANRSQVVKFQEHQLWFWWFGRVFTLFNCQNHNPVQIHLRLHIIHPSHSLRTSNN